MVWWGPHVPLPAACYKLQPPVPVITAVTSCEHRWALPVQAAVSAGTVAPLKL